MDSSLRWTRKLRHVESRRKISSAGSKAKIWRIRSYGNSLISENLCESEKCLSPPMPVNFDSQVHFREELRYTDQVDALSSRRMTCPRFKQGRRSAFVVEEEDGDDGDKLLTALAAMMVSVIHFRCRVCLMSHGATMNCPHRKYIEHPTSNIVI